jgi:hypothetical protein
MIDQGRTISLMLEVKYFVLRPPSFFSQIKEQAHDLITHPGQICSLPRWR